MSTSIRFPKLDDNCLVSVEINRSGVTQTPRALKVCLKGQCIEGVEIPQGTQVWIPGLSIDSINSSFSMSPKVRIPGWKMNELLKGIILKKLKGKL